jgi:hypothetical protein
MRLVRRASVTVAVALMLLGAQASQVLHELVVPHETCPLHGDLVEGDGHSDDGGASQLAAPARARLLAAADGALHGHDRCLATFGDTDAVESEVAALTRALPPAAALPAPPTASAARRSVPLFRLAPKNSPPV